MLINSSGQNMSYFQSKQVHSNDNQALSESNKVVVEKANTMGVGGGNDQEPPVKPK